MSKIGGKRETEKNPVFPGTENGKLLYERASVQYTSNWKTHWYKWTDESMHIAFERNAGLGNPDSGISVLS